jgi:transposase InsO family protein
MAQHDRATTFQDRVAIMERAALGQSDPEIACALSCSVWTVRTWRRISQKHGRMGLTSTYGRPRTGPLGTVSPELRAAILTLRQTHPGWGPDTMLAELRLAPCWRDQPLPSRSRIAALLKHAKLTRRYERHSDLPLSTPVREGTPHDRWELDAQGAMHVAGVGKVALITIVDVVSRMKVESYPCLNTTNPPLAAYQLMLRRAFLTTGLPRQISFDHGTVFFDNTSRSPFPTRLHLWLLALGVEISFTCKRCPTDHAKIERTHQTMTLQALLGQAWSDPTALWAGLDARRARLNQHIPSGVLGGRAPLDAYPSAAHAGRSYRPAWEADMLNVQRVYQYLSTCRWFRPTYPTGVFALGGYFYNVSTKWGGRTLELRFDGERAVFIAQPQGSADTLLIPPRGLTKEDRMGEFADGATLPSYQLALPFSHTAWRALAYARGLAGTTS